MAAKYVCDGCGKEAPARLNVYNTPLAPPGWLEKPTYDGLEHKCPTCQDAELQKLGQLHFPIPF